MSDNSISIKFLQDLGFNVQYLKKNHKGSSAANLDPEDKIRISFAIDKFSADKTAFYEVTPEMSDAEAKALFDQFSHNLSGIINGTENELKSQLNCSKWLPFMPECATKPASAGECVCLEQRYSARYCEDRRGVSYAKLFFSKKPDGNLFVGGMDYVHYVDRRFYSDDSEMLKCWTYSLDNVTTLSNGSKETLTFDEWKRPTERFVNGKLSFKRIYSYSNEYNISLYPDYYGFSIIDHKTRDNPHITAVFQSVADKSIVVREYKNTEEFKSDISNINREYVKNSATAQEHASKLFDELEMTESDIKAE